MTKLLFQMASQMNLPMYGEITNPHSLDFHQNLDVEGLRPLRLWEGLQDATRRFWNCALTYD